MDVADRGSGGGLELLVRRDLYARDLAVDPGYHHRSQWAGIPVLRHHRLLGVVGGVVDGRTAVSGIGILGRQSQEALEGSLYCRCHSMRRGCLWNDRDVGLVPRMDSDQRPGPGHAVVRRFLTAHQ